MSKNEDTLVLVADDEPSMLALLSAYIRSKGYRVLEASDGDMAWQLAHEHLPHCVVLDVMMPGMSGWEVCKKIRESVSLAHTGVVMLTGIGESLNEMTSPLYGADAYIDKPFEFAELEARIKETLESRQGGALGRPDGGGDDDADDDESDDDDDDDTSDDDDESEESPASSDDDDDDDDNDDDDDERPTGFEDEPVTQRLTTKTKRAVARRKTASDAEASSTDSAEAIDEAKAAVKAAKKAGKKASKKAAKKAGKASKKASKKVAKKAAKKAGKASKKVAKKAAKKTGKASKKVAKKAAKKAGKTSKKVAKKTKKKAKR